MKKRFFVDGWYFTKELDGRLTIEFKVAGIVHSFKINAIVAKKMAEAMKALYLEVN